MSHSKLSGYDLITEHAILAHPTDTAFMAIMTRNSSGDEIATVNFLNDDIIHALHKYNRLVHKFGYAQIDAAGTQVYEFSKITRL